MQRLPDWPQRLRAAIEERKGQPHQWGQNDCVLYAADLVAAMTGIDLGARFRGTYADEPSAKQVMEACGWSSLADVADAHLRRREQPIRRGDIALIEGMHGLCLVMSYSGGLIGPGPRRPAVWPMRQPLISWSVG